MRLRPELHLILWVVGGLSLAATALYRAPASLNTASPAPEAANMVGRPPTEDRSSISHNKSPAIVRIFPEIDQSVRSLFDTPTAENASSETPVAPIPQTALPVLKGIISSDGNLRAVFVLDPSTGTLATAQIGDHFAGFWLREINSDGVVGISEAGDRTVFALRGAGEGQ